MHLSSPDVTPASPAEGPVMVLLHGYGSNERDLPGLTPHLPALPWVSVRAPLPMPGGGAAWFPLDLPGEPSQDAIEDATVALWDWVDQALPAGTLLVPIGFSQGGLMALQLLRTRPERIAATAVLAGLVTDAVQPADGLLGDSRPPLFWGRGLQDPVIWPDAIARLDALVPRISTPTIRTYAGLGHGVNAAMLGDLNAFLVDALDADAG